MGLKTEIITLKEFSNSVRDRRRLLGRVIGRKGETKRKIEAITETKVIISDYDITITGSSEGAQKAKEVIIRLLEGRKYSSMNKLLYSYREGKKKEKLILWEKEEEKCFG